MAETSYSVSWPKKRPTVDSPISVTVPASKSELNRLLILAALNSGPTEIKGKSRCDDVEAMIVGLRRFGVSISETSEGYEILEGGLKRLRSLSDPVTIDCRSGGTTFRFLSALAAALPRRTELTATPQLLHRPHDEFLETLRRVAASVEKSADGFLVRGFARWPKRIEVRSERSSQFSSAMALVASGMGYGIGLVRKGDPVSRPYWDLTLNCIRSFGSVVQELDDETTLISPSASEENRNVKVEVEADASSSAVWLAAGALGWPVAVRNYPKSHRQADRAFVSILKKFGSHVEDSENGLHVVPGPSVNPTLEIDLRDSPDLAPVVAVLSALMPGKTKITGASHLRFKESNRIEDLKCALASVGIEIHSREDGLDVAGNQTPRPGIIQPFGDHRIAMAGSLLGAKMDEIVIRETAVVNKSYPEFWEHCRSIGWRIEKVSR